MATFSLVGNKVRKNADIVFFPWKAQDLDAMRRFGPGRRKTNVDWNNEFLSFSHLNGGMDVETPPFDLSQIEGDLIIMGHGDYGDRIGKDSGYTHSARSLAKLLAGSNLPRDFANKIILWSCFAGTPSGMAQSLAFKLKGRGYMTARVWGCKWVTKSMANRTFYCVPNTTPKSIKGEEVEATLNDMGQY